MTRSYDPRIITGKSVLMQQVAAYARAGYFYALRGTVPLSRAALFVRKFRDIYVVHLNKDQRYRRKRAGLGNAVLMLWRHDRDVPELTWVLMVTDGDHPAHTLEPRLRDLRKHDERFELTGYELVQITRSGARAPSWTWRLTEEGYGAWRTRIVRAVRQNNDMEARQAWYSMHQAPGFAPVRAQTKRLIRLMRAEWARRRATGFPFGPTKLFYLARLPVRTVPLAVLLAAEAVARPRRESGPTSQPSV